jgi:hypothetical protein
MVLLFRGEVGGGVLNCSATYMYIMYVNIGFAFTCRSVNVVMSC